MPLTTCEVSFLQQNHVPLLVTAFAELGWDKPASLYQQYLAEQENHQRCVWVALQEGSFAGYITLKWQSEYAPFHQQYIPEISDFNVLPTFRKQGIGSKLLDLAEAEARKKSTLIGIGVGLYADYGDAQRLYVRRGYVPDGLGITYNYQSIDPGNTARLDDDLVLWFRKEII
ncbi:MAG: GNAT family N-acetyltransferase [Alphaproteobacteria bacterium]|nr:GNAT family N-acetyltransferase [Alphaproteobacteria bacterium]